MVTQSTIAAMLTVLVAMGILPIIAGIILLATKKFKGSAFWSGLGSAFFATIVVGIIQGIMMGAGMTTEALTEMPFVAILNGVLILFDMVFMFIFLRFVLKKSRSYKSAVSFGCGFGLFYLVTVGMSMISYFMSATMINSGTFDSTYSLSIQMGAVDKETVLMLKNQILSLKAAELLMSIPQYAALILALIASAAFILRGVSQGKTAQGLLISTVVHVLIIVPSLVIKNVYVATAVMVVVGIGTFIFAHKLRGDITEPEEPAVVEDDFLKTVKAAQEENNG